MAERADLLILGGGLAGLALAERLAHSGAGGRVRILEPRTHYTDDRSWAFWTPSESHWAAIATRTWERWRCSVRGGASLVASAAGWRYAFLRSSTIYDAALRAIAAAPRITLEQGVRAGAIKASADGVEVTTSAGTIVARQVIDTRPPHNARFAASRMFQCFAGRELALEAEIDDREVELMTDMRADAYGFVFSYVLPISPTRVLVEATRFSTRPLGADVLATDLDTLVAARGWARVPVLRTEQAVLPMGLPASRDEALAGLVLAGTPAGALRAASGYGFLRIQAWAERCAAALARDGRTVGHPNEPRLRQWMDELFLRVLTADPTRAPEFFLRLAGIVPSAAFVRFLSDQASVADIARIVTALPPWPFLRALGPQRSVAERTA